MSQSVPAPGSFTIPRRADLDAVRAFAMLLGIALHAGLSFATIPWIVQDTRQNEWFTLLFEAIHGFRMQLFFLVSGFFTAMLWRKRGLRALLKQRATRILLPLILGLFTIIPATQAVSIWAIFSAAKGPGSQADDGTLIAAVRKGDVAAMRQRLQGGADVGAADAKFGVTPLNWAAMRGDTEAIRFLIDAGADVNAKNKDGSTALHSAAFLGRDAAAELLIKNGAITTARNLRGQTPLDVTKVDWSLTSYIASLIDVPIGEKAEVEQGRLKVAGMLAEQAPGGPTGGRSAAAQPSDKATTILEVYHNAITSERLRLGGEGSFHLIQTPVFAHLWFLWFLCWLVPMFAAVAWVSDCFGWGKFPRRAVLSPTRFLWLVPLTLLPQLFMGLDGAFFGPDESSGFLPKPHVLLYYGVFFAFGALYFDADDDEGRLGRWWWLLLPAGFLVALPIGIVAMQNRAITSIAQVTYAWTISFAIMGLFRKFVNRENTVVRYMSDASYWLYLTHLPLVLGAQAVVRDWSWPAAVKFVLICCVVTGILLVAYQWIVRYTWIGRMLNGPRTRAGSEAPDSRPVAIGVEAG
jgi:peptidoglycan/LPS O-acetylase OafA/YrhL